LHPLSFVIIQGVALSFWSFSLWLSAPVLNNNLILEVLLNTTCIQCSFASTLLQSTNKQIQVYKSGHFNQYLLSKRATVLNKYTNLASYTAYLLLFQWFW